MYAVARGVLSHEGHQRKRVAQQKCIQGRAAPDDFPECVRLHANPVSRNLDKGLARHPLGTEEDRHADHALRSHCGDLDRQAVRVRAHHRSNATVQEVDVIDRPVRDIETCAEGELHGLKPRLHYICFLWRKCGKDAVGARCRWHDGGNGFLHAVEPPAAGIMSVAVHSAPAYVRQQT